MSILHRVQRTFSNYTMQHTFNFPCSLSSFSTLFFTIATFVCSPIYLNILMWPVHMKAHPLVWFEHFLLYFKEYKRFRYKFKKTYVVFTIKIKTYKNLHNCTLNRINVRIELQKKGKAKTENISWLLIIVDKDSSPHNKRCVLITQKWPSCSRNLWK